jgi:hypothetical protein
MFPPRMLRHMRHASRTISSITAEFSRAARPIDIRSTRLSLFPLALQDEGGPIIRRLPLFLFPDRQLRLA